jgi:hypothetical protein
LDKTSHLPQRGLAGHAGCPAIFVQNRAFPPFPSPKIPSQQCF